MLSAARVGVALVKGSDLDLTSVAGRVYAGVLGECDTAESEIKAERVARAAQQCVALALLKDLAGRPGHPSPAASLL